MERTTPPLQLSSLGRPGNAFSDPAGHGGRARRRPESVTAGPRPFTRAAQGSDHDGRGAVLDRVTLPGPCSDRIPAIAAAATTIRAIHDWHVTVAASLALGAAEA
eukprot:751422-Hanusia_phi.AAC.5